MRQDQALRNLQANFAALHRASEQVATGKRFFRPSEDPVAAASVIRTERDLRGVLQYRRNLGAARARLDAEESVLNQVTDILARAKELAVAQGSDTATAATRNDAALEVDRLIEQVVSLGNTKVGEEHLFGGHLTAAPPFQADGTYVGDDGVRQAEIASGYVVDTTHTGRQLLVTSGVLAGLDALRDELRTGTGQSITGTIAGLDAAFSRTQATLADTGARLRQIDTAATNLDALESSLEVRREADQGIDLTVATTRLVSIQTTLQAALLSTSRIMGMSLTEYLR